MSRISLAWAALSGRGVTPAGRTPISEKSASSPGRYFGSGTCRLRGARLGRGESVGNLLSTSAQWTGRRPSSSHLNFALASARCAAQHDGTVVRVLRSLQRKVDLDARGKFGAV